MFEHFDVPTPDGSLHVVRARTPGRPLLVIHGGPDWDHSYLLPAVAGLCGRGIRPLLFDLRGCGQSFRCTDDTGYTVDAVVGDIVALLDTLGLARADVLGFSFGGVVAQALAARQPQRIERLVLASTAYPVTVAAPPAAARPELRALWKQIFDTEPDPLAATRRLALETLELDVHRPEALDAARRLVGAVAFSGEWLGAVRRHGLKGTRGTLESLGGRVRLVHGEYDARFAVEAARAAHAALPGAALHVLPGAGHLAYLDVPADWQVALAAALA
ncbi:alpha/beta fold hydrolase [Rubrivivax gelatinosus]|uniref:3-oxoadipate enol-lactonase n=1 Tax=Rubrivivax gelatinosus TaxID=28068 RepID=A0A4R2M6V4_RUBGE|nr:alpha/beta hydrolase [Rubrivivax gelatinosus]TCP01831.1 3-oxoadipate enol-lactonase [Rubrivivax gelatinosus]